MSKSMAETIIRMILRGKLDKDDLPKLKDKGLITQEEIDYILDKI
jgi:hypothetical protein